MTQTTSVINVANHRRRLDAGGHRGDAREPRPGDR
jgi:hypothetical protein